jgi:predicted nucleic acid-binding protein
MRRILFDTNVVLDVLLDRKPYAEASAAVWAAVETGAAEGMLAAHAVTTIHYLVRKEMGNAKAKRVVSAILRVFGVAAVDGATVQEALQSAFSDFEDAVTAAAAHLAGCECIVTRDPKGFRGSSVRVLTPEALLPLLNPD